MIATHDTQVTADELWSIVSEVWESILGSQVRAVDRAFNLEESLTSAVAIHGDWEGLVTFTCPPAAAADLTRAMLAMKAHEDVTSEDVQDAVGEIANVVGGQVKRLCAGVNRLGLPQVATGLATPRAQACCRAGVEWAGHVARVVVWRWVAGATGSVDGEAR